MVMRLMVLVMVTDVVFVGILMMLLIFNDDDVDDSGDVHDNDANLHDCFKNKTRH